MSILTHPITGSRDARLVERFIHSAHPTVTVPSAPHYLGHEALVFIEPRLSHGSFSVKAPGQLLQLLLPDELTPQGQLPLVLSFLQAFPGLHGAAEESFWDLGVPSQLFHQD